VRSDPPNSFFVLARMLLIMGVGADVGRFNVRLRQLKLECEKLVTGFCLWLWGWRPALD
jgi:hypothetical protein